ncbi:MAG: S-DNA-T family [Candidatus Tokpelaia sp. JSC189]|nr:MAG: S-DNA-T family [Candidatus Tokpelaia sp. JSC189]
MRQGPSAYDIVAKDGDQPTRLLDTFYRKTATFLGSGLLAITVLAGIALVTWNIADPSLSYANNNLVTNILGFWGAVYADLAMQFFGLASVIALLPPFFWSILLIFQHSLYHLPQKFFFWILSIIFFSAAVGIFPPPSIWPLPIGLGGVFGDKILDFCHIFLDRLPLPSFIIKLTFIILFVPLALIMATYAGGALGNNKPKPKKITVSQEVPSYKAMQQNGEEKRIFSISRIGVILGRFLHPVSLSKRLISKEKNAIEPEFFFPIRLGSEQIEPDFSAQNAELQNAFSNSSRLMNYMKRNTGNNRKGFELPHISYLTVPKKIPQDEILSRKALAKNTQMLTAVLEDFGIKGDIINAYPGPVVTLYELEPAPGVKSARIISLADDIARSMSAVSARIAVVPGRNAIGIELPNSTRETVYLREMLETPEFQESKAKLGLTLGKTIGGDPIIADLSKMPHLLVAGTTGSGKSVAINTMIMSLVYRMTPEECRLIMVDPKMLELSVYDGIPHLLTPVVTDPKKAIVALKWTVREMEDRYRKMAKLGVRNIDGYNDRIKESCKKRETLSRTVQTGFDKETGEPVFETEKLELETMPYIVVIIDEMADLMMVAGKDIEGAVQRLAQMARAAGIHVIMATQRPSVDIITGTIKANFPTRISFAVTSKIDSRTILGEQGAEQLLGQGDMLFMIGGGRIQRVHGPFVGDSEVEQVVAHLKTQGVPEHLSSVMEESDAGNFGDIDSGVSNNPYDQAIAIVLRDRKASTSYIQRRLGIGYNRAATIIERMEEEGIISPANHAGKREILIPEQENEF